MDRSSVAESPGGSGEEAGDALFWIAVVAAAAAGLALRAAHLSIPMRYDEAHTFLEYASRGAAHAVSSYETPNNHVLHSLLVGWVTDLLGESPVAVRLPAFLAGCLVPVAVGWLALKLYGRNVGVLAAALAAVWPVLVEYSVNGRGYTMVVLASVLAMGLASDLIERPTVSRWIALGVVGVLGFYTIPLMLYPWVVASTWIVVNAYRGDGVGAWLRRLAPLVVVQLLVGVAVLGLYAPILDAVGPEALVDNRFVSPRPWSEFTGSLADGVGAVASHWAKGVPAVLVVVLAAGLLTRLGQRAGRHAFPLLWAILFGVTMVLVLRRNLGFERIWLWCLPLVLTVASSGVVHLVRRVVGVRRTAVATAVVAGMAVSLTGWRLFAERPVFESLETGAFHEGEDVAVYLMERFDPGDGLLTDWKSIEPLEYYFAVAGFPEGVLTRMPGDMGRLWVLVNGNESDRSDAVERRARGYGVPLATAVPVFESGPVRLYVFGGAPGGLPLEPAEIDPG